LIAVALALRWNPLEPLAPVGPGAGARLSAPVETVLPEPLLPELALRRARALFARGHLYEALAELESVRRGEAWRPEADRLQAQIQRALLDATATSSPGPGVSPGAGRP
jgi:hypothetical protein